MMLSRMLSGSVIVFFSSFIAPQAFAADGVAVCDFLKNADDNTRVNNCKMMFESNLIPNKKALEFTLGYLRDNTEKLADDGCLPPVVGERTVTEFIRKKGKKIAKQVQFTPPGQEGLNKDYLRKGIKNPCHFLLNDVQSGKGFKSNGYFVDLCSKDPNKIVTKMSLSRGTGSGESRGSSAKYTDIEGRRTTVIGAFLTGEKVYDFQPFKMSAKYQKIKAENKAAGDRSRILGLRLMGVNSSNNETSEGKPLHQSKYSSSWGCPSSDSPGYREMLKKLADGGPSLVMNYGPEQYHKSTTKCDNTGENPSLPEGKDAPIPQDRPDATASENTDSDDETISIPTTPSAAVDLPVPPKIRGPVRIPKIKKKTKIPIPAPRPDSNDPGGQK